MRTSYSQIESFLQCPQKFKFSSLEHKKAPKSREALFGSLIHDSLRFLFSHNPLYPTLDEVLSYYRKNWPKLESFNEESDNDLLKRVWSEQDDEIYFRNGINILKKFYEKNAPWNFNVAGLESRFEAVLKDEKTGATHILAGVMDRIDTDNEAKTFEIIDYKTSAKMPSQDAVDKNLQLSVYALGLQNKWPHIAPEDISLSLYFVKHGMKLSTKANTVRIEETKKTLLKNINKIDEKIRENKEFEPMPGPLCNWCGYRPICPAWRHLYKSQSGETAKSEEEFKKILDNFFRLKREEHALKKKIDSLIKSIKVYMDKENLTRVFSDGGTLNKRIMRKFSYDFAEVKQVLEPLDKWESVVKIDESKLKTILSGLPEEFKSAIEEARKLKSELITLSTSLKRFNIEEF